MIATPACLATSGIISGIGFASANTIGSFAIFWTNSGVRSPARDTPMNTSASVTASSIEPDCDASTYSNSAVFQRSNLCVISDNSSAIYRHDVFAP